MSTPRRNFLSKRSNSGDNIMRAYDIYKLEDLPAANQAPAPKVIVRRGGQLMVVFAGCPGAGDVQALLQAEVEVGLALRPGDLANISGLDDYSYMFVGNGRKGGSSLKQAVGDLAHNGWSIDEGSVSGDDLVEPSAPRAPIRTKELARVPA